MTSLDKIKPAATEPGVAQPQHRQVTHRAGDFAAVLQKELARGEGVHFSKHAIARLQSRNIHLTPQDEARLAQGIERAAGKGGRDSLIVLRELAFIVNVQSRTVVTAVAEENFRESIFTNIDSAVLL